jgi:hypothetical protein
MEKSRYYLIWATTCSELVIFLSEIFQFFSGNKTETLRTRKQILQLHNADNYTNLHF